MIRIFTESKRFETGKNGFYKQVVSLTQCVKLQII